MVSSSVHVHHPCPLGSVKNDGSAYLNCVWGMEWKQSLEAHALRDLTEDNVCVFLNSGPLLGSPCNKDHSRSGFILGAPHLWTPPSSCFPKGGAMSLAVYRFLVGVRRLAAPSLALPGGSLIFCLRGRTVDDRNPALPYTIQPEFLYRLYMSSRKVMQDFYQQQ